jgi:UDP-N-acetylmuramate dehydrogenase
MLDIGLRPANLEPLQPVFGKHLLYGVPLTRYTTAHSGGAAEALLEVRSIRQLVEVLSLCWKHDLPYLLLGGGSNVLISEAGVRGLVIINRARAVRFDEQADPPTVWAESGANFGRLARQAAQRGFSGLEWAAGIPGTLGGAVVGNAGAHGGDMAGSLLMAEILHRSHDSKVEMPHVEQWPPEKLEYSYRSSLLKRQTGQREVHDNSTGRDSMVLGALLKLARSTPAAVQAKMDEFVSYRKRTQPPGASLGSMFKNPPGDHAGRLIEAAGLKGFRVGDAQISPVHANFFVNLGQARSTDIYELIQTARKKVAESFGVRLELEVELVGEW